MNTQYSFSRIIGKVNSQGRILFTKNGERLISIIGNRVSTYNLLKNYVETTFYGHTRNIDSFSISQSEKLLILSSKDGSVTFLTYPNGIIIRREFFSQGIVFTQFSEKGNFFFLGYGKGFSLYQINPKKILSKPNLFYRNLSFYRCTCCDWVESTFLCVGTSEGVVNLFKIGETTIVNKMMLSGNKGRLVAVFFGYNMKEKRKEPTEIYCVDEFGFILFWKYVESGWKIIKKKKLTDSCNCCDINFNKQLIIIGEDETYKIFSLKDTSEDIFPKISELKFSDDILSSILFNPEGNLIAGASSTINQLLLWDWRSKTFVLKQKGHLGSISSLCYSPNGDVISSGDNDGVIKVWNYKTGQSFVTLSEHTAKITSMKFSRPPQGRDVALFTSSLDGTCRAFDLLRYKNYQTFVAPSKTGFTQMSINKSGEIIAASGETDFKIYVWNVKNRQLMDTLSSHTAPITYIEFSCNGALVTSSWDYTIKIWNIYGTNKAPLDLLHSSEVITFDITQDGNQICSSTSDGQLNFWDLKTHDQTDFIECKRDILITNQMGEKNTILKIQTKKYYTHVKYTSDGNYLICGGQSPLLGFYHVQKKVLLRRFVLSSNLSLSGTMDFNSFYMGSYQEQKKLHKSYIHERKRGKAVGEQFIPGSQGELIKKITVSSLQFSPTNQEFIIATEEGIIIFSSDSNRSFQPIDIDLTITPNQIFKQKDNYLEAMKMALRLNDFKITSKIFNTIPVNSIQVISRNLPYGYLHLFLKFLAKELENSSQLEYILLWLKYLLLSQGELILEDNQTSISSISKSNMISTKTSGVFRSILRELAEKTTLLSKITEENIFSMEYLTGFKFTGRSGKRDISEEIRKKKKQKIQK